MDKKWIEGTLRDFDSAAGDCGDYDEVVPIIAQYVKLIAQATEEDKRDALKTQDAAWHDIEDDHIKSMALMAEALNKLIDVAIDKVEYEQGDDILEVRIHEANAALSAAPKVAARLKMQLRREPMGDRYLEVTDQDSYLAMGTLRYDGIYDVFVMASEQDQPMPNYPEGHKDWHAPNVFDVIRGEPLTGDEVGQENEEG